MLRRWFAVVPLGGGGACRPAREAPRRDREKTAGPGHKGMHPAGDQEGGAGGEGCAAQCGCYSGLRNYWNQIHAAFLVTKMHALHTTADLAGPTEQTLCDGRK